MNDAIGATHGDFVTLKNEYYWSSTAYGSYDAYAIVMGFGPIDYYLKGKNYYVRCVRDQ